MKIYWFVLSFLSSVIFGFSQENTIPLWEEKIPNYRKTNETEIREITDIIKIKNVQQPSITVYLPSKNNANKKAILICPGGGYGSLAYDWEGTEIAKWLNSKGIAAFVLKYRLPQSKSVVTPHETPLQDAKRAIRLIRYHAKKWNIEQNQIGVMGFSAGGHLASTLGTHYESKNSSSDNINNISTRPDFMALIYPVITMKLSETHLGSRENLLGKSPKKELVDFYSNEQHINTNTPPTFMVHATDDSVVSVENSLLFYQGLKNAKVYSEMHIYPKGGHGFALAIGRGHLQTWTDRFYEWIQSLDKL